MTFEEEWLVFTTEFNGNLVYFQIVIDCLLRIKTNQTDNNELLTILKKQYEKDSIQLNLIYDFQYNYSPTHALVWYSKNSFFYRTLNQAFYSQNIHMLFLYHSYLSDIYQQLKQHQCKQSIRVYRNQIMSLEELRIFEEHIGKLIRLKSFVLTHNNRHHIDQQILFEIDANPDITTTKPFAYIDESRVLFMFGSIFRINKIYYDNNNCITIQISLCNDDEIVEYLKQQNEEKETNLSTLANILWKMGHLDLAHTYFSRFLDELSMDDPLRNSLYQNFADLTSQQEKYEESLEWHQKLMRIKNEACVNINDESFDVLSLIKTKNKKRLRLGLISIEFIGIIVHIVMFIENLSKLRQSIEELLFILYYVFGLVLTYNRGRIGLLIYGWFGGILFAYVFFYPCLTIFISIWAYSRIYGLNLSINHLSPVIYDMSFFSLVYLIFNSISNLMNVMLAFKMAKTI